MRQLLALAVFAFASTAFAAAPAPARCQATTITVNGQPLWVDYRSGMEPTVVFEAGGGNDSSAWASILPKVQALGLGTFIYDRAGLGRSAVDPSPYSIQREVGALHKALSDCQVRGELIVVAHSYGGIVSQLLAAREPRVKGIVLLDAVVPGFYDDARLQRLLAKYRPQYAELREKAPALAATMIPLMEAYPATAAALEGSRLPSALPIIDIVAERPAEDAAQDIAAWNAAHAAFVRASSARTAVLAKGSGHKIAEDRPDLVLDAVQTLAAMRQRLGQLPVPPAAGK